MNSHYVSDGCAPRDSTPAKAVIVLVIIALGGAVLAYEWHRADSATNLHTATFHPDAKDGTNAKRPNDRPPEP